MWCCQLGNRQLTSSPLPNFEALSRHHFGPDRTVCVQVVLEVRPAPVYPALLSAAGLAGGNSTHGSFVLLWLLLVSWQLLLQVSPQNLSHAHHWFQEIKTQVRTWKISCSRTTEFASPNHYHEAALIFKRNFLISSSNRQFFNSGSFECYKM